MKYKLLIDCSIICKGRHLCSLDYYAIHLIKGFKDSEVFDVTAIVRKGMESYFDDLTGLNVPKIIVDEHSHVTRWPAVDKLLGLIPFKKELIKRNIDIVLTPYHFDCRFFFPKKYHQHAVVHDLIPYYVQKGMMGKFRYLVWRIYLNLLIRKIPNYIAISEETRKDLYKFERKDSVVVHNSLVFDFSIKEKEIEIVCDRPYILDVNCFNKHKNAETLIRAFALISGKIPHMLYLKGDRNYEKQCEYYKELATKLHVQNRIIFDQSYRPVEEMRYLYTHADLFVSPSLIEGFGWTPIEAAVLKVPVLVSDTDIFKEITCGKVPTFNPYSPGDIAEKMLDILHNPPKTVELEKIADFYVKRYSIKQQICKMEAVLLSKLDMR